MKLVYLLSVLGATKSYASPLAELLTSTSSGPVQGYPATVKSNVAAYLGIPFGQTASWQSEIPTAEKV